MFEQQLVRHCAPTLAGLKSASLFSTKAPHSIQTWDVRLSKKGVHVQLLSSANGRALVLVYRPALLQKEWRRPGTSCLLRWLGYNTDNPCFAVSQLRRRMESNGFPHEIGLFLGYPLEDVAGFIRNDGQNCKCCGYWKVYGCEQQAQKRFDAFRRCTRVYYKCFLQGVPIQRLTIAA